MNNQLRRDIAAFHRMVETEGSKKLTADQRLDLCDELLKLARSYDRLMEAYCNFPLTPRQQAHAINIKARIKEIARLLGMKRVIFNQDPRAVVVKLITPRGTTNGWGQDAYCVPTF